MNEKILYEYAVIRIVPRVEREEFINAGLILFAKKQKKILCKTFINQKKIACYPEDTDMDLIKDNLASFEKIANGENCDSPIAALDEPSRFRWLTAAKSTIVQCSPVHPGLTDDVDAVFKKLFQKLVM